MERESRKEEQEDISTHQPYGPRVISKHFSNGVLIGRFKAHWHYWGVTKA